MMGERRVMQEALFYGFSLERHVPDDHLLRKDIGPQPQSFESNARRRKIQITVQSPGAVAIFK